MVEAMKVNEAHRYCRPWLGAASRDAGARHVFHSSVRRSPPSVFGSRAIQLELRLVLQLLHASQPALLQTASSGFRSRSLLAGQCRGFYCSIERCPFMRLRLIAMFDVSPALLSSRWALLQLQHSCKFTPNQN
jgi:hypothetical protein